MLIQASHAGQRLGVDDGQTYRRSRKVQPQAAPLQNIEKGTYPLDLKSEVLHVSAPTPNEADSNLPAASDYMEYYETRHTLTSLYLPKQQPASFKVIDHLAKRKARDMAEIVQAGRRLGLTQEVAETNLMQLQTLIDMTPNLFKMKAALWAQVLLDVQRTASVLIAFKTLYPAVDATKVVAATPKMLLKTPQQLQQEAVQVSSMLRGLEDCEVTAILEAAPVLVDPQQLGQALHALATWFPDKDPLHMLLVDPTKLLNVAEADLDADPLYGEVTTAG